MSAEHEHYEEKDNTEPDNVNVGLIGTVTAVGAILVVSIALALTALVRNEASAHGNEVGAYADLGTVSRLKTQQRSKLEASPAWADRGKGLIALPITRAMELTTTDIQRDPGLATKFKPVEKETPDGGAAAEGAPGEQPGKEGAPGEATPGAKGEAQPGSEQGTKGAETGAAPGEKMKKGKEPAPEKGATAPQAPTAPQPGQ